MNDNAARTHSVTTYSNTTICSGFGGFINSLPEASPELSYLHCTYTE